jgi:cyanate lyase
MTREELTVKILGAKRKKWLSWKQIAEAIGPRSPILYAAAQLGQMTLTKKRRALANLLELDETKAIQLTESPYRGSLSKAPPGDLRIYRCCELVQPVTQRGRRLLRKSSATASWRDRLQYGDQREENPKGDRVQIRHVWQILSL